MATVKKDLIDAAAQEFQVTKVQAEKMIQFVLDTVIDGALETGTSRFGKHMFKAKTRAARRGVNPSTGQSIEIPAKKYIAYKRVGGSL